MSHWTPKLLSLHTPLWASCQPSSPDRTSIYSWPSIHEFPKEAGHFSFQVQEIVQHLSQLKEKRVGGCVVSPAGIDTARSSWDIHAAKTSWKDRTPKVRGYQEENVCPPQKPRQGKQVPLSHQCRQCGYSQNIPGITRLLLKSDFFFKQHIVSNLHHLESQFYPEKGLERKAQPGHACKKMESRMSLPSHVYDRR